MVDAFTVKLILAFIVGATWITGATIIAERFGSKIGGVISGLPSTSVLALFFIGWTQTPLVAAAATNTIPAIMGLDAFFVASFIFLSKNKLLISVGLSLLVWFLAAMIFVLFGLNNFGLSLLIFAVFFVVSYILGEKIINVKSQGRRKMIYTPGQIIFRAGLTGSIVSFAVIMTKLGGPVVGGVFASFPAIMTSTMIITKLAHGRDFSVAVMKVMMVSGSFNCVIYTTLVGLFYPTLGLITGTISAFAISLFTGFLTYLVVNKKMS